ncbi:MAG: TrkA family potassium uptake protein [Candidatus Aminicenantales bacterium]
MTSRKNEIPSPRSLFVIVVGCGRLGGYIASSMSRAGHSVVVIDVRATAFDKLSAEFSGFRVEGDATETALLRQVKTDKADALVATTREDNVNLMIAQVARKIFGVKRVMARVFDPGREELYHELGIETVCPTCVSGNVFLNAILEGARGTQESK